MARPIPAGRAALPMADAATCRLTVRVVPVAPVPTRAAVVKWLARTVPGAIVRRTGHGHFGDPDADTVERLAWLAGHD